MIVYLIVRDPCKDILGQSKSLQRYLKNEVSKWEKVNRSDHHPVLKTICESAKELRDYRLSLERRGFSVEKVQ